MSSHLAQLNVGRLRAPVGDPLVAEFIDNLDRINAIADASPGFVWRLQTEEGNATAVRPYEDESILINLSLWESLDALADYVYRSDHAGFLRRRRQWFEKMDEVIVALWWVPAGHIPTEAEAVARLDHLRAEGPTAHAFTFRQPFAPPGETADSFSPDARNACPA